jgi:hypothetical protein
MKCENIGLLLSKYVDQELTPQERKEIEEHLSACLECREVLSIFLKNDRLISSALQCDLFGDNITRSVMERIQVQGVLTPVHRWSGRHWIALVAGLLILILGGIAYLFIRSHSLEHDVALYKRAYKDISRRYMQYVKVFWNKSLREEQAQKEIASKVLEKEGILAHIGSVYLIQGKFPKVEDFVYYNVYRKDRGSDASPIKLNSTPLSEPRYHDQTMQPGQHYEYIFEGVKRDGKSVYSLPIYLHLPPIEVPSKYIQISYLATLGTDTVLLAVSKEFDHQRYEEIFMVRIGEDIGRIAYVIDAEKELDFSTGVKLIRIEEADELMTVSVQIPCIDPKSGKPVLDPVTLEPKLEYRVHTFSRPNRRITVQTRTGRTGVIWQGRSIRISPK